MNWRRICATAAAVTALAAFAGPAAAGSQHWFYDSFEGFERGAVVDFGVWAGPPTWVPGYYAPPGPRNEAAFPPLYPGERPVRPELYREVAPGQYVPIYGDSGKNGYRRAPASKPSVTLNPAPKPRAKPGAQQKLATKTAEPSIVETDRATAKVSGSPISCAKARHILVGFGFSDIHAQSCSGKQYGFSAKRDGKDFDIKLSSLTGELIQVRRR